MTYPYVAKPLFTAGIFILSFILIIITRIKVDEMHDTMIRMHDSVVSMQATIVSQSSLITQLQEQVEALQETSGNVDMWPYPSTEFYAGLDDPISFDDGTMFTSHDHLDYGKTLYKAASFIGSVYVSGNLVVDMGSVFVRTANGHLQNLSAFIDNFNVMPGDTCADITKCVHGMRNILTCDCMCDVGWTGTQCDAATCNGYNWDAENQVCVCVAPFTADSYCLEIECGVHGSPNPDRTACTCEEGWSGGSCSTPEPTTECSQCQGECVDNVCTCLGAQFGQDCEYECATPEIDTTKCPYRENWALDMPCTTDGAGEYVCTCGGGYDMYGNSMSISELRCSTNLTDCSSIFSRESPICCAPEIDCEILRNTMCDADDNACCASLAYTSESQCHLAGCSWCSSYEDIEDVYITACVARAENATNCSTVEFVEEDVTGDWRTYYYGCNDVNTATSHVPESPGIKTSACNSLSAQKRYTDIYQLACGSTYTYACLISARDMIYAVAWPELDTWPYYDNGLLYRIIAQTSLYPPLCYPKDGIQVGTAPMLAINMQNPNAFVLAAGGVWTCAYNSQLPNPQDQEIPYATRANSAFTLEVSTQTPGGPVDATLYNIMLYTTSGNKFCLVEGPPTTADSIRYFGATGITTAYFFVNLKQDQNVPYYMPADLFCTAFEIKEEMIVSSATGQALSLPVEEPSTFVERSAPQVKDIGTHILFQLFQQTPIAYQ